MDDNRETENGQIRELLERLCEVDAYERLSLLDELSERVPDLQAPVKQLLENYDLAVKFFERVPELHRVASGAVAPARTLSDGEIVAERFRIRALRGQGGIGEVYEADDLALRGEPVALKTLRASLAADEGFVEHLAQELRLTRKISHPNVCRVHDVYQHQTAFGARISIFTMELLDGETLATRLQRGPMPTSEALPIVRQIAAAIDAAHAVNVAHGDLKPGNIMLVPSTPGAAERVVVTDFGLARWLPAGSTLVTARLETRPWGTPVYMAPEQLFGGRLTRASDIYALGVVCYEMVTGQQPFALDSPVLLAVRKLRQAPRPPREVVPGLDPRWQKAILRCLDVDPERRFRFANDLVNEIEGDPRRRKLWAVGAIAAAAAIAVTWTGTRVIEQGAAVSTTLARQADVERTVAVLPFLPEENGAPEDQAFALGLTAALADDLGSMSRAGRGLHVIPAEEVINTGVNTPALAQQKLGASLFVAARVSATGNRPEITIGLNELSDQVIRLKESRKVSISSGDRGILDAVAAVTIELLDMHHTVVRPREPRGGDAGQLEAERSYLLGRGYLAQGATKLTAAIDSFQRAIKQRDRFAPAHAGLGEAYRLHYVATRDTEALRLAQASIDRAIDIEPRDVRAHIIRGRLYLMTSQYPRAILEFQDALGLDPDAADARRLLADAYKEDGAIEKAEETYREAVARHPRHWSAHEVLGTFLYNQGRYREAEESFVKGSQYAPANRTAILNLSAVYLAQEKFAAAEAEATKGTELAPDALLYNNLAWAFILQAKFDQAVKATQAAVKLPPADSLVWSSLARAYRWAGERDAEERAAYEAALQRADEDIRVRPFNAEVKGNRAYLLVETGRTEAGLREIAAAVALESAKANVIVFFNSALIHEWVGDRKRALQDLQVAARGGYSRTLIERHPDLARLRRDPGYRLVLDVAGKPAS